MTGNFCGKCFYDITRQDNFMFKEKNHWEGEQLGHIVLTLHIIVDIVLFHDFCIWEAPLASSQTWVIKQIISNQYQLTYIL